MLNLVNLVNIGYFKPGKHWKPLLNMGYVKPGKPSEMIYFWHLTALCSVSSSWYEIFLQKYILSIFSFLLALHYYFFLLIYFLSYYYFAFTFSLLLFHFCLYVFVAYFSYWYLFSTYRGHFNLWSDLYCVCGRGWNPQKIIKSENHMDSGPREDLLVFLSFYTLCIHHVFTSSSNK